MASHTHAPSSCRVAILGAGAAGLCMAMQLRRAGISDFVVLEKSGRLGGTWRDNTYPGAGCDVPSHLYSFSFAPNPGWTRSFADQAEILAYLEQCATDHDLHPHIRYHSEVTRARFDDQDAAWHLDTAAGDHVRADIVVTGCGQLNRPHVPRLAGLDRFAGTAFHSARWDHDHDLSGRSVAVIGNGASAIQFIPLIAPRVARLTIFQRSANWIVPKPERVYTAMEKWLFRHVPGVRALYRYKQYWALEARFFAFARIGWLNRIMQRAATKHLAQVSDPALREMLTPDYPLGCKRILLSNDYYRAVQRDHVTVIDRPITRVEPTGIATDDGVTHPVDTLIFATGFESTRFLTPIAFSDSHGRQLSEVWRDGARAYLGMMVAGFPNLFLLYGPNTNLGHNSILFMIECQTRYILRCLEIMDSRNARSIDVKPEALQRFDDDVQARLHSTVWSADCSSWYKTETGRITNNWASFTAAYWWRTRRPDLDALDLRP